MSIKTLRLLFTCNTRARAHTRKNTHSHTLHAHTWPAANRGNWNTKILCALKRVRLLAGHASRPADRHAGWWRIHYTVPLRIVEMGFLRFCLSFVYCRTIDLNVMLTSLWIKTREYWIWIIIIAIMVIFFRLYEPHRLKIENAVLRRKVREVCFDSAVTAVAQSRSRDTLSPDGHLFAPHPFSRWFCDCTRFSVHTRLARKRLLSFNAYSSVKLLNFWYCIDNTTKVNTTLGFWL